MRVVLMASNFDPSREVQGITLLCVALAALSIYAPSRWTFRRVALPDIASVQRYLPYLYLLYFISLPVQMFKNYRYYQFAQEHGGYLSIFLSHAAITSTVPFIVRIVPIISFPVFIALFAFERRKPYIYVVTMLYFATASLLLALGARGGTISLVLVLWWVARVKSDRRSRVVSLVILAIALLFVGDAIRRSRENDEQASASFAVDAVLNEGAPLNMTEMAVQFRSSFSRYSVSYLLREMQNAFVAGDKATYYRGESMDADASVLLNPIAFSQGAGVASSFIGEAYVLGCIPLVVIISLVIGFALSAFYRYSTNSLVLFLFALSLPEILLMPRAQLFDWASVLIRNSISVVLLVLVWRIFAFISTIRSSPAGNSWSSSDNY